MRFFGPCGELYELRRRRRGVQGSFAGAAVIRTFLEPRAAARFLGGAFEDAPRQAVEVLAREVEDPVFGRFVLREIHGPAGAPTPRREPVQLVELAESEPVRILRSVWVRLDLLPDELGDGPESVQLIGSAGYDETLRISQGAAVPNDDSVDFEFTDVPPEGTFTLVLVDEDGDDIVLFERLPYDDLVDDGLAPDEEDDDEADSEADEEP